MKINRNQEIFLHLARGLSAVAVMAGHSMDALHSPPGLAWYRIQSGAVVVFFVISGFLICYTAARKQDYSFRKYLIDRGARIYVAFLPALALTMMLDWTFRNLGARHSLSSLVANLVMFQGIPFDRVVVFGPFYTGFGSNSPLWSVGVEWWLYMAFGVVFFSSRLRGLWIAVGALLAVPALGVIALYSIRENLSTTWIIAAAAAVPISLLSAEQARRFAWAAAALFGTLFVMRVMHLRMLPKFAPYDGQLMFMLTFFMLSLLAALRSVDRSLFAYIERPIVWLSDISYSLYLIHYPILGAYLSLAPAKLSVASFLFYNLIGLISAWLFTRTFDRHHGSVARWLQAKLMQNEKIEAGLRR